MTTTQERPAGLLGMKSFSRDAFKLRYQSYLVTTKLPPVPAAFGHFSNKPPGHIVTDDKTPWGMLGNDKAGCCVLAGAAHEDMLWHSATHKSVPRFTSKTILDQYYQLTSGRDEGLDPAIAARWRAEVGLKDADGNVHKVKAFALIDSIRELEYSTFLYGAAGVGFWLPASAEKQFSKHHVWDDISAGVDYQRGHYVSCLGRNSNYNFVFATWGDIQAATPRWVHKYFAGGVAYFADDYLTASGLSPEGINQEQLTNDLAAISKLPHL